MLLYVFVLVRPDSYRPCISPQIPGKVRVGDAGSVRARVWRWLNPLPTVSAGDHKKGKESAIAATSLLRQRRTEMTPKDRIVASRSLSCLIQCLQNTLITVQLKNELTIIGYITRVDLKTKWVKRSYAIDRTASSIIIMCVCVCVNMFSITVSKAVIFNLDVSSVKLLLLETQVLLYIGGFV